MALTSKKYTRIYSSEGNDSDKIDSDKVAKLESDFNSNSYLKAFGQFDMLAPVLHILQKLTEEIDYLRTEISANKDKTGITSQQATDINNNKTKISTNTTNIANKLKVSTVPIVPSGVEQEVECGVVYDSKAKTYSMMFAYSEITVSKDGKKTTRTRTGSIQLK